MMNKVFAFVLVTWLAISPAIFNPTALAAQEVSVPHVPATEMNPLSSTCARAGRCIFSAR